MGDSYYKRVVAESPIGFASIRIIEEDSDKLGRVQFIETNPAFEQIFNRTCHEAMPDQTAEDQDESKPSEIDWCGRYRQLLDGSASQALLHHCTATNEYYKICTCLAEENRMHVWATNVTEAHTRLAELERLDKTFQNVIDGSNLGIWELNIQTGEQTINERWAEMLGYTMEELWPISIHTWLDNIHPDDLIAIQPIIDRAYVKGHGHYSIEFRMKHKNGEWVWIDGRGKVNSWTADDKPLMTSGTHADITAIKKSAEEMLYISYHDQLTGLYNRRFYEEELKRLDAARNLPMALIMADVNGLKLTNDAFGHQEGDRLLQSIAQIIKSKCRSDEIVARIGGDEFVILLPKTNGEEAKKLIGRIYATTLEETKGNKIFSLSLGYAVKTSISENMSDIFMHAEDDMYRHKLSESSSMRSRTIDLIMNSLFEKSRREMMHSKRVSELCEAIAANMYFPQEEINQIRIAGLVHDIGKIGISNLILDKAGALTHDEYIEMKKHSEIGYRILSSVSEFSEIAQYVFSHQERWDGAGYPRGLQGTDIPIQARIIAVADAFDAMTSNRTYRSKLVEVDAAMEMRRCAGTQFDPDIVKLFLEKVICNK